MVVSERVFTGTIDWAKAIAQTIYILNSGNLYIFGLGLNLIDLPYNLGPTHRIAVNEEADVYFVSTKGLVKGFNHRSQICYTPIPVTLQSLMEGISWKTTEEKEDGFERVLEDCWVEDNHNLYVSLR